MTDRNATLDALEGKAPAIFLVAGLVMIVFAANTYFKTYRDILSDCSGSRRPYWLFCRCRRAVRIVFRAPRPDRYIESRRCRRDDGCCRGLDRYHRSECRLTRRTRWSTCDHPARHNRVDGSRVHPVRRHQPSFGHLFTDRWRSLAGGIRHVSAGDSRGPGIPYRHGARLGLPGNRNCSEDHRRLIRQRGGGVRLNCMTLAENERCLQVLPEHWRI